MSDDGKDEMDFMDECIAAEYEAEEALSAASCSPLELNCKCGNGSTGWMAIRCCNLCGLPHKDETTPWGFNLTAKQKAEVMNQLIFKDADYEQLAMIAAACTQQMVDRCGANDQAQTRHD